MSQSLYETGRFRKGAIIGQGDLVRNFWVGISELPDKKLLSLPFETVELFLSQARGKYFFLALEMSLAEKHANKLSELRERTRYFFILSLISSPTLSSSILEFILHKSAHVLECTNIPQAVQYFQEIINQPDKFTKPTNPADLPK